MPTSKRPSPKARQTAFTAAISQWLKDNGFAVGIPTKDVTMDKTIGAVVGPLASVMKLAGLTVPKDLLPLFLRGGMTAAKAAEVLRPFAEVSNLVALNFEGQPTVLLVIYADRLSPDKVFDRLEYCRVSAPELAQYGVRVLGFGSIGGAYIVPLLVFFEAAKVACWDKIKHEAWYADATVVIQPACVNVAAKTVEWAENNAPLYKYVKPVIDRLNAIGHKEVALNDAALAKVLDGMRRPVRK